MVRHFLCSTALMCAAFSSAAYAKLTPAPVVIKAPYVPKTAVVAEAPCAPVAPVVVDAPCALAAPCSNEPAIPPTAPAPSALQALSLRISGQTSFNSWFFHNDKKMLQGDAKDSTCKRQRYGRGQLFTVDDARLRFAVDGKLDSGMEYGLVFVFDGVVSASKVVREDYIFFNGSWGKVILGDTYGVQGNMTFGGYDQWGGTGFIDGGDFDRVVNYTTGVFHSVNLVGDSNRDTKATYITPRWEGFQAGISYVPRTEHRGQDQINSITSTDSPKKPFDTDNIANAINFIHKFENGFEMALSASSIFAARTHPEAAGKPHRRKTFSYAFGGTFSYADIGFSAEFGNNGRSREIKRHSVNAGKFIDFGLSYTWGATKFSAGYYYSWRKALSITNQKAKAKLNAVSAAIDQKLAPGLGVYVEYAHFNMKNRVARGEAARINATSCDFVGGVPSNKANVFVVGSRLVF